MSCNNNGCYLPQPPRAWSRVQNSCSLTTNVENNGYTRMPLTGELIPTSMIGVKMAMLNKGNVLQYKANSSNLTKTQRYSKIAKGQWVNRNTTWATQSTRGYTNPNTTSLKRSGNVANIAIDPITGAVIGQTTDPVTCPKDVIPINEGLPSNSSSSINDPVIPPPVEPSPSSDVFPELIEPPTIEPIVIQDEGTLICSVQENVCTGETKRSLSQQLCNPTTDSDVPGPIQDLCWNDGTPTWYPRSRYIMTNSTNKWPVNATLFSAIKPLPPVITSVTSNMNIVTLTWSQNDTCLPVDYFDIYQNGEFIKFVSGNTFTTEVNVENCTTYQYFIIARTNTNISSDNSNVVSITIQYIDPPSNLKKETETLTDITGINTGNATITISWDAPKNYCGVIISYKIYIDNIQVANSTSTQFTTSPIGIDSPYTIYVTTICNIDGELVESNQSQPLSVYLPVIYNTSASASQIYNNNTITITYNSNSDFIFNYDLYIKFTLVGGGGSGANGYNTNTGTSGGGGGEILNSDVGWNMKSDTWEITIGSGQTGSNTNTTPNPANQPPSLTTASNSLINAISHYITTNSTLVTNDNPNYAGGGGQMKSNYTYYGGGGVNNNSTSANGGLSDWSGGGLGSGGGAGGSLRKINQSGTITYNIGHPGSNSSVDVGGNGGAGQTGIDGTSYGGGGGGGSGGTTSSGGSGGSGGGGAGGNSTTPTSGTDGATNTGGGGGGGYVTSSTPPYPTATGDGADGVVILQISPPQ